MTDYASVEMTNSEPRTGRVSQVTLRVNYGPNESSVSIPITPGIPLETLGAEHLLPRLRELGEALLRIAQSPSALVPPDPRATKR